MKGTIIMILAGAVLLGCYLGATSMPTYAATGPTVAVKETIDEVIRLVTDEELKKAENLSNRRTLLQGAIGQHFSFSEMAKRSLAAHWKGLSEREHHEFVLLFKALLTKAYAKKIESYSDQEFQYNKERLKNSFAEVQTKIISGQSEFPLDYRMIQKNDTWYVYDVVVNGVSMVKNYRSQFDRIIRRSSYENLVVTLREKSNEIKAP